MAKKIAIKKKVHGEVLVDEYSWIQNKKNPEVIRHIQKENIYSSKELEKIRPLSEKIYREIKGRHKHDDINYPSRIGKFYYYSKNESGKQYFSYWRRLANDKNEYDPLNPEMLLIDGNEMSFGHSFFEIDKISVSPDERFIAFLIDTTGDKQYRLQIKDIKSGKFIKTIVNRVTSFSWAEDSKTIFLIQEDKKTKRPNRLIKFSTNGKLVNLYFEKAAQFSLHLNKTSDGKFIEFQSSSTDTTESWFIPLGKPNEKIIHLLGRETGHKYQIDHRNGEVIILTNRFTKNFGLFKAKFINGRIGDWEEIVKSDDKSVIKDFKLFANHLAVFETIDFVDKMKLYDFNKSIWKFVEFLDENVYSIKALDDQDFISNEIKILFQSPIKPPEIVSIDMESGKKEVVAQEDISGDFDPNLYETKRLWATAEDGVKIPIWVVHKKGIKINGNVPILLSAYGSYGIPTEATFSSERISLLNRGVIYAEAHVRGGNDLGEIWHENGMLLKKKNTFSDFISCAEFFLRNNWTSSDKLIIQGSSAGGLLMGVVANMRPDLFAAVHANVPFLDILNTMLNKNLPLTSEEYLEWGNPENKDFYNYIRSYSPYDNIEKKAYPSMLITAGFNDSQVMYWEAVKYVAKLRSTKTDNNKILLKVNMNSGHDGPSGIDDALWESSQIISWMLNNWGINN